MSVWYSFVMVKVSGLVIRHKFSHKPSSMCLLCVISSVQVLDGWLSSAKLCVTSDASNFTLPNHPSLVPRPFIWMTPLKQVKSIFTEPIEMQFIFTLACLDHSWGI